MHAYERYDQEILLSIDNHAGYPSKALLATVVPT